MEILELKNLIIQMKSKKITSGAQQIWTGRRENRQTLIEIIRSKQKEKKQRKIKRASETR